MAWSQVQLLICALACSWVVSSALSSPNYLIGRGMFDMTGPAGEINMVSFVFFRTVRKELSRHVRE